MDERHIAAAVLSVPPPGVHFGDQAAATKLARRCNEYLAEVVAAEPGRLGAFAVLPLPDVAASLDEITYALDTLGLDGVGLYSNVQGRYLGDPLLEPIFAELHRRRAVCLLHPVAPPIDPAPRLGLPNWFSEYVFDSTRALANMAIRGTFARHPDLTLIVTHAGGTAPYIANRIVNAWREFPGGPEHAPEGPIAYLRRLYFDTASCGLGHALRLVRDFAGADRIVVGTDFPFVPAHSVSTLTERMADPGFLGVGVDTLRDNGLRLFPRFGAVTSDSSEI
jgi:predicted TIM-barrel fold metal-dependent hydrolase